MTNDDTIRNPYNPTRPATSQAMFFGREDVFAFIRQRLITGPRSQAVAVIGQCGIGKTSLLAQIPHRTESRYVTAYIDLADVHFEAVGGLFAAMADAARQALDDAGVSTYRLPPIPEEPGVDLWKWFSETYLDVTLSAMRNGRRLIFLFDETSKLLDAIDSREVPAGFGTTISELMGRDERMDIIFAVDADDEQRLETFAPLADPMLHRRLGRLDDAAAQALIRRPPARYYAVQDEAVQAIIEMSGGHPYLLHVLNGLLWERAIERGQNNIAVTDVTEVLRQSTDEADPILRQIWSRSTPNERQALSALTTLTMANQGQPVKAEDVRVWLLRESDHPLDETALAAALRRLEYREVLWIPKQGTYTFTTGLQYQWLVLNGDVQPPVPVASSPRPAPRRLAIPIALLLVGAIAVALLVGYFASKRSPIDNKAPTVTFTLDQNLSATRQAIAATQTRAAGLSLTPSPLPTILKVSPTSVVGTNPPATNTPSSTPLPSNTPTATDTPTASDTPTITPTETPVISITPPIFPTGQIRAPAPIGQ